MAIGKYSPIVRYFTTKQLNDAGYDNYGYSYDPARGIPVGPDPMGYTDDDYQNAANLDLDYGNDPSDAADYVWDDLQVIIQSGVIPPAPHPLPAMWRDDYQ
jgi:hypothetical protein